MSLLAFGARTGTGLPHEALGEGGQKQPTLQDWHELLGGPADVDADSARKWDEMGVCVCVLLFGFENH